MSRAPACHCPSLTFDQPSRRFDGPRFGHAILGLAPTQPYVTDPDAFVAEVSAKMSEMKSEMEGGEGRAGDNIRSYMASVRRHQVKLDPTVMVALMSMLVLEGWQVGLAHLARVSSPA